ncbi:MAG: hypothetical protein APF81_14670 [Desulfosporosinus sp. BRH_c37]|nr:MAG: hypothetical protein APF81_14670 [Desulfosporosinus sp. BRH_c37]
MKFGGDKPNDPYETIGPQGFPMQLPNTQLGQGYSPGAIRNTLGSGLKASGFFQKDGQIQNSRGGFIGAKQLPPQGIPYQAPPLGQGVGFVPQQQNGYNHSSMFTQGQGYNQNQVYYQAQTRQLILEAAQQGIMGNGVATISPDNSFLLIANLPAPNSFLAQGQTGMYASYLVDEKGKTGFLVGLLRSVGNGVYRTHFQSQVPLHHYSRVVVSVENPVQLGQAPNGPIILKVKEPMGMMTFLTPMRNTATTVWGKVSGLFKGRKKPATIPEAAPINSEIFQSPNQMEVAPGAIVPPTYSPPNP